MKISKILILVVAAWLGTLVYARWTAISGLLGVAYSSGEGSKSYSAPRMGVRAEPKGGIGEIGAPDYQKSEVNIEAQENGFKLLEAAANGDRKKAAALLAERANPNARDGERRTPLMFAAAGGHGEVCGILLAAGANAELQDRNGNDAYDYAAGRGLTETVAFLLARTRARDSDHWLEYAALIQLAYMGDAAQLPEGTGRLASVNRISPENQSPLHIAAGNGSAALVAALLARGANPNVENNDRQTPMHWAAWNNQPATVAALADKGADLSARDLAGDTPLMVAAKNRSLDAAKTLLSKGARKDLTNKEHKTAEMIAEDAGFGDVAALLR